jgi:hypothetical protein
VGKLASQALPILDLIVKFQFVSLARRILSLRDPLCAALAQARPILTLTPVSRGSTPWDRSLRADPKGSTPWVRTLKRSVPGDRSPRSPPNLDVSTFFPSIRNSEPDLGPKQRGSIAKWVDPLDLSCVLEPGRKTDIFPVVLDPETRIWGTFLEF